MIPYLIISQLWIVLLVLIIAVIGFSELFRMFIIGLGLIMGGYALIGKTHCKQLNIFSHNKLKMRVLFCAERESILMISSVSRKEATDQLASLSCHRLC